MKNEEIWKIIITGKFTVKWYFVYILYESILNNKDRFELSTIHKYKYIVECLKLLLKMYGWDLDTSLEKNPIEEKQQGDNLVLIFLRYQFVRNPVNKAIIEEEMKDKKNQELLTYLLDRIKQDRKEKEFNTW